MCKLLADSLIGRQSWCDTDGDLPMLKHFTIILAFLTTIGTQVCAADIYKVGDVFYCNETAVAFSNHYTGWKVANGALKAFRFRLIEDTSGEMLMKFGSSGDFANETMNVAEGTSWALYDEDNHSIFRLNKGRFTYAGATIFGVTMRSGTCDNF